MIKDASVGSVDGTPYEDPLFDHGQEATYGPYDTEVAFNRGHHKGDEIYNRGSGTRTLKTLVWRWLQIW